MPDANGRIPPVFISTVPRFLERCEDTGLTLPECRCPIHLREVPTSLEQCSKPTRDMHE